MTGTIEWIHAVDGTVTSAEAAAAPSLEELQKYVEGYIEVVNVLVDDEPTQMIRQQALRNLRAQGNALLPANPNMRECRAVARLDA
jgi:glycyl-tRNA synthetase beta subunit